MKIICFSNQSYNMAFRKSFIFEINLLCEFSGNDGFTNYNWDLTNWVESCNEQPPVGKWPRLELNQPLFQDIVIFVDLECSCLPGS